MRKGWLSAFSWGWKSRKGTQKRLTFSLFFTTLITEAFEATHWLPVTLWQVKHINHHGGRGRMQHMQVKSEYSLQIRFCSLFTICSTVLKHGAHLGPLDEDQTCIKSIPAGKRRQAAVTHTSLAGISSPALAFKCDLARQHVHISMNYQGKVWRQEDRSPRGAWHTYGHWRWRDAPGPFTSECDLILTYYSHMHTFSQQQHFYYL